MKLNPVTATEARQAGVVIQTLQPAIAALRKITAQALGYNAADIESCAATLIILESHVDAANGVADSLEAHKSELGELIGKVALRSMSIASDIELHQSTINHLIAGHEHQVDELNHKGFTSVQIEQISPFPADEIDLHKAAIEELKAEKLRLEAFLQSSPAYETNHLRDTVFRQADECLSAESEA